MPLHYPLHCLIGTALVNSPSRELKVNEIYSTVQRMFPSVISKLPQSWKNSLRHCLSKSSYFEKVDQYADPLMAAKKGNRWRIKPDKVFDLYKSMEKYNDKIEAAPVSHTGTLSGFNAGSHDAPPACRAQQQPTLIVPTVTITPLMHNTLTSNNQPGLLSSLSEQTSQTAHAPLNYFTTTASHTEPNSAAYKSKPGAIVQSLSKGFLNIEFPLSDALDFDSIEVANYDASSLLQKMLMKPSAVETSIMKPSLKKPYTTLTSQPGSSAECSKTSQKRPCEQPLVSSTKSEKITEESSEAVLVSRKRPHSKDIELPCKRRARFSNVMEKVIHRIASEPKIIASSASELNLCLESLCPSLTAATSTFLQAEQLPMECLVLCTTSLSESMLGDTFFQQNKPSSKICEVASCNISRHLQKILPDTSINEANNEELITEKSTLSQASQVHGKMSREQASQEEHTDFFNGPPERSTDSAHIICDVLHSFDLSEIIDVNDCSFVQCSPNDSESPLTSTKDKLTSQDKVPTIVLQSSSKTAAHNTLTISLIDQLLSDAQNETQCSRNGPQRDGKEEHTNAKEASTQEKKDKSLHQATLITIGSGSTKSNNYVLPQSNIERDGNSKSTSNRAILLENDSSQGSAHTNGSTSEKWIAARWRKLKSFQGKNKSKNSIVGRVPKPLMNRRPSNISSPETCSQGTIEYIGQAIRKCSHTLPNVCTSMPQKNKLSKLIGAKSMVKAHSTMDTVTINTNHPNSGKWLPSSVNTN